ncbi:MAG: phosphoglucosamine mutase [Pseudomonadota bacterium]
MGRLFGTDGVRGVANIHPMTSEVALQLGRGAAYLFRNKAGRHRVVIGKDTRLSGYMIENAIAAGICSMGVDILLVGPMPTPGIAFITTSMRADAGIVISASHNPFQDNGIKIFSRDGFKLPDEVEERIEALMGSAELDAMRPTAREVGKAYRIEDARGRYIEFLKHTFPREMSLDGLKIVLDCANGAAYRVAPTVLEELGAELVLLGVNPDGENINLECGSLHPDVAGRAVRASGADLGISLDGDADRAVFVDERGEYIDGDKIMALLAEHMLAENTLKHRTLVATVMSNMGLDIALERMGGKVVRAKVGDRYVVERMLAGGFNLGGEQSGHMIFLDHSTTGDGILSALQVLAVLKRAGRPLSEVFSRVMETFPQKLVNVRVARQMPIGEVPGLTRLIENCEAALGGRGRILVRFSGTEPLARVMIEGEDELRIADMAQVIADHLARQLG